MWTIVAPLAGQAARRRHQGERILLVAQMADGDEVGVARRPLDDERRRRLDDDARFRPAGGIEAAKTRLLQHDQSAGTLQRMLRVGVPVEVAIEVGPGEHEHERRLRATGAKARDRLRRAARMQGDQQVARHPSQARATSTSAPGARKRCQRAAVCQLPLFAAASAGETIRMRGRSGAAAAIGR